jgi:hypothetical protein
VVDKGGRNAYERLLARIKINLTDRLGRLPFLKNAFKEAVPSQLARTHRYISKGVPMLAGLALMPVVVHPIDGLVNLVMNLTYRPVARAVKNTLFPLPKPREVSFQAAVPHHPGMASGGMPASSSLNRGWMHSHFSQYR